MNQKFIEFIMYFMVIILISLCLIFPTYFVMKEIFYTANRFEEKSGIITMDNNSLLLFVFYVSGLTSILTLIFLIIMMIVFYTVCIYIKRNVKKNIP